MAEPQFTPVELDRIEDALESLEVADLVDDGSPAVRERLVEYRDLLVAARDALPLQEVPAGVLDGVLAEARRSTEASEALGVADPAKKPAEGFWARLRRSLLIPGLAVAGAAALVLIIARPTLDAEEATLDSGDRVALRGNKADANAKGASAAEPASPQRAPAAAQDGEKANEAEDAEAQAEQEGLYEIATSRRRDQQQGDGGARPEADEDKSVAGASPAPVQPSPAATPVEEAPDDQGPRWDVIARGDRARRKGDCKEARPEYQLALADSDHRVQARAYAGLGLCDAWGGESKKAMANYGLARDLDPEVTMFIEEERPRSDGLGKPSAAKKRKSKSKPAIDPKTSKKKAGDLDHANQMAEPLMGL